MEEPTPAPEASPVEKRAGLFVVGSPIGNLGDITLRALNTLRAADAIACEDTRHSLRLLQHYQIEKPLFSLNEHNEARRIPEIISHIQGGQMIALLSDAGMPTVSDPGQRLVHAVIQADCHVETAPGPSAVLAALAAAGLPTTPFYFGGFLPHKKGQRAKELAAARARDCTSIYFESPYRLVDTLMILATDAPEHPVVVARELTKRFEEYRRGTATALHQHFQKKGVKGEITLLIGPGEMPKWTRSAGATSSSDEL